MADVDLAASRFRDDSELAALDRADGAWTPISPLFTELLAVALRAARLTDGDVDPTVGAALSGLGYDRDVAEIAGGRRRRRRPGARLAQRSNWTRRTAACAWRPASGSTSAPPRRRWTADTAAGAHHRGDRQRLPGLDRRRHRRRRAGARRRLADPGRGRHRRSGRPARRPGHRRHHPRRRPGDLLGPRPPLAARRPLAAPPDRPAHGMPPGSRLAHRLRRRRHAASTRTSLSTAAVVRGDRVWPLLREARLPVRLVTPDGQVLTAGGWPEERAA